MDARAELHFDIDGMSCGGCVGRAEKAIAAVPGVSLAAVNLATHSAKVTLDDPQAGPAIKDALATAGYPAAVKEEDFAVEGMTCGSCVARVEDRLAQIPGVLSATVNLADGTARVNMLTDTAAVQAALTSIGYAASLLSDAALDKDRHADEASAFFRRFLIAAMLTLPVFILEMGGHLVPAFHHLIARTIGTGASWTIQFILTTAVLLWPGRVFFAKGVPALLRRAPDMNALVVLGASAAWIYSTIALFAPGLLPAESLAVYYEAAAVIVTLILLGRWLEARAKGQTGAAIKRLIGLRPATARVIRDGQVQELPIGEIIKDDVLVIRPGERIATDGVVTQGASFVDESMVTGEPLAVEKLEGAALVGGTINGKGALQMRATAVGADTMLARIIAMVQEAQSTRLPVQDLVNRITAWFVPAIIAIAVFTVAIWLIFGPSPVLSYALVAGVCVLIIACPCAMGLATPTSIMVGTGRAAEMGVLFRQGDALQSLQAVDIIAFDKTGTLTQGKPELTDVIPLTGTAEALLSPVAAVEALSEHPLAAPILAAAEGPLPEVSDFAAVPGYGLRGQVDGAQVLIGAARYLHHEGVDTGALAPLADRLAAEGKTPIMIAIDGQAAGVIGVADQARGTSKSTIRALHSRGIKTVMITGDVAQTAAAIGTELGIENIVAEVLPERKTAEIRKLQASGAKVGFVGDGINDAAALAAADVGIAIGTGTDVAVESADVVLMAGDPAGVLNGLAISRATMRNIQQNLGWAFGYNVLLIPVAAGALFPIWGILLSPALAAGAMALSSVLVVSNALRLRGVKAMT